MRASRRDINDFQPQALRCAIGTVQRLNRRLCEAHWVSRSLRHVCAMSAAGKAGRTLLGERRHPFSVVARTAKIALHIALDIQLLGE
jgi:hypothetical protein